VKLDRRHGQLRLRLEAVEAAVLESLFDQVEALLDGPEGDGAEAIRARLAPAAYRDDAEAQAEFERLTAETLRADRNERFARCRAELAAGRDLDLTDPEAARRWLQVLNDLRLALGTRLEVSEDDPRDVEPDDPDSELWALYHWLTAVQDSVVVEMMA
jgi:hypothetical protein